MLVNKIYSGIVTFKLFNNVLVEYKNRLNLFILFQGFEVPCYRMFLSLFYTKKYAYQLFCDLGRIQKPIVISTNNSSKENVLHG